MSKVQVVEIEIHVIAEGEQPQQNALVMLERLVRELKTNPDETRVEFRDEQITEGTAEIYAQIW